MNMKLKLTALTLACAVSLPACTTMSDVKATNNRSSQSVEQSMAASARPSMNASSFVVDRGFYAASRPIDTPALNARDNLPEAFRRDASMGISASTSIAEIGQRISRMSGYQITFDADVNSQTATPTVTDVAFKGTLEGLLDYIANQSNVSWRYQSGRIHLFRYETRMFRVSALAGTTDVSTTMDTKSTSSGSSAGSATGGASGQTTKIDSTFDLWKDIEASVKSLLSASGSLSMSTSAAILTVRDTPAVLAQVDAQIREFNRIYSRQVMMNVEVYAVERSASDSVGMDWELAWSQAANKFGLGYTTSGTNSSSASPMLSGTINSGPFAGSGVMFQALSSIGKTTLLTNGTVSSLNGQSVPLNISREQAYLQSFSTTIAASADSLATTTLTPGVVTDGFSMNFTPRIMEGNKVMMRYSIDLSTTDAIDTFESPDGNSAIQLPRRSVRNFMQNVNVQSGQTMVLTGVQQAGLTNASNGPGSPGLWFLGGRKKAEALTRTIVIVVTPYVIE